MKYLFPFSLAFSRETLEGELWGKTEEDCPQQRPEVLLRKGGGGGAPLMGSVSVGVVGGWVRSHQVMVAVYEPVTGPV